MSIRIRVAENTKRDMLTGLFDLVWLYPSFLAAQGLERLTLAVAGLPPVIIPVLGLRFTHTHTPMQCVNSAHASRVQPGSTCPRFFGRESGCFCFAQKHKSLKQKHSSSVAASFRYGTIQSGATLLQAQLPIGLDPGDTPPWALGPGPSLTTLH